MRWLVNGSPIGGLAQDRRGGAGRAGAVRVHHSLRWPVGSAAGWLGYRRPPAEGLTGQDPGEQVTERLQFLIGERGERFVQRSPYDLSCFFAQILALVREPMAHGPARPGHPLDEAA